MALQLRKSGGFSLVELMAAVAIISVLGSMINQTSKTFIARAKQTEAKINLNMIHNLQMSFHADKQTFLAIDTDLTVDTGQTGATFTAAYGAGGNPNLPNPLGFALRGNPTKISYAYSTGGTATAFTAFAY